MSRILIVRTSALGDVVQALPVLQALRRHLPGARIGWLVEEPFAPLLAGHPDLDTVIAVRLRQWRKRPLSTRTLKEMAEFFTGLHRFAPEIVLDLMGNHKAGILAALTLADRRVGFAPAYRREPSSALWLSETVRPRTRHSVDKMLAVLDALGIPQEPAEFGADRLPASAAHDSRTASQEAPRVLIHPGAGWGNKRYPAERWGEVAHSIHSATGLSIGVIVGLGEGDLAAAAIAASQDSATAVEAPTLLELTDLLRRADLVLGGDTGPVHLAHALGRPVLCLMGPTDPATCGPYDALEKALWRQLPCSFCHKRYAQTMPCLEKIPPTEVAARARAILEHAELPEPGPLDQGEAGCLILH